MCLNQNLFKGAAAGFLIQFYSARFSLLIVPNQVVFRSQAVMIVVQTGVSLVHICWDFDKTWREGTSLIGTLV